MRFHIGFSKRISKKTIIFLLGLLSIAFAMFFGNTEIVFADTTLNHHPGSAYYFRNNASGQIYATIGCNSSQCYFTPSNYGMNAYNFTWNYDFGSISCSSRRADITLGFWLRDSNINAIDQNLYVSSINGYNVRRTDNYGLGYGYFKFLNVNLDEIFQAQVNASNCSSDGNGCATTVGQAWVTANIVYDCITDSAAQIMENATQNTQDIMNNDNQNTQTIIDSFTQNTQDLIDNQNDDNVSTANSTSSNFFNNFHIDDTRGLTSVITAPIRLLQGIINSNDSCDPYTFTIQILGTDSKTVSLPSGCILWNNVPSLVVVSYWVIVWAIVGYRCLVDMIHFTSALRDPDHKNDYTLDL